MTKENKPEMRFSGFNEDWKQRKLGDIATFLNGRAYSQDELQSSGKYKILRVGNFYTNDSWYYSDMELGEKFYANKGDLLYTWSATFGPHIWEGDKVIYHYHIWKIALTEFLDKMFALQLLEQDKSNLLNNLNGSTMVHMTKLGMESKQVIIPNSLEEQAKIGSFFTQLDNTITLQQRKLELLKNQKKAFLEKMFPKEGENVPEIRFSGFSDAWKQCKLSDLVNVIDGDRGKNYPTEADFEPHGHTLFLNASNVTIDGFLFDTNQFITEEKSNSMGSGKIIKDDIIITSRGSLGHIAWYNDSVQQVMPHLRINSGMLILRNKANVKTSYLHQFMKSDKGKAQIVFMSFGSAQPQLTKKGVESFTVNYPIDTEEQIKIGAFFSKLDNTITLQQRKLEILKNIKKSFLQKMFV